MASFQLCVALLGLFCFTSAALDQESKFQDQIRKEVTALQKEKQSLAKRYASDLNFSSRVLDRGFALVEQMEKMVEEFGIEAEFPSVAEFVQNLKIFLKETKDFTFEHMSMLVDEFGEKENEIKSQLLKLLEDGF